jgi:hypothetical protein
MQLKKHQLRAELRGHLAQVLEERGIPTNVLLGNGSFPPSATSPSSSSPSSAASSSLEQKKLEYARALRLQMEEARKKAEQEHHQLIEQAESEPIWFDPKFDSTSPLAQANRLTADQQKAILLQQMEEARRRREQEERKRAEEDAKWEEFATRQRHQNQQQDYKKSPLLKVMPSASLRESIESENDWRAVLYRHRKRMQELEQELSSVSQQLEQLKVEETRIVSHLNSTENDYMSSPVRTQTKQPMWDEAYSTSFEQKPAQQQELPLQPTKEESIAGSISVSRRPPAPSADDEVVIVDVAKPLNVAARYFVYIAKPNASLSPKTPSPPDSPWQQAEEDRSVYEDPTLQRQLPLSLGDDEMVRSNNNRRDSEPDDSDDDDDDEDPEDVQRQLEAARKALARADYSSGEERSLAMQSRSTATSSAPIPIGNRRILKPGGGITISAQDVADSSDDEQSPMTRQSQNLSINSFLDADVPYELRGTPHSKLSTNSFDT